MKIEAEQVVTAILRALVRPALRFCLRRAIAYQALDEVLRAEIVKLAAHELGAEGSKPTVSQLSVATGLSRREITRLHGAADDRPAPISLCARVINQWGQDRRFCSKAGKPKTLSFEGPNSEFHQLVASVSKDVHPYSLLVELERVFAVEKNSAGLKLIARHESLRAEPQRGFELMAEDIETLNTAVTENLDGTDRERNLHLRTEYDNIFLEDLPQIRRRLLEMGSRFHQEARDILARHDKDLNPQREGNGGGRVVLGCFSWAGNTPAKKRENNLEVVLNS